MSQKQAQKAVNDVQSTTVRVACIANTLSSFLLVLIVLQKLVKNLLRVSLSLVCYIRRIFPEDCFVLQDYAGMEVHQLDCVEKAASGELTVLYEDAFKLTQWLERGVFDAFEKRYLKSVAFCLYKSENNEDKVLESYQFGFEYPDSDRATLNGAEITRDNLRQQAIKFMRCLIEFSQTLEELPEERWFTMKVSSKHRQKLDHHSSFLLLYEHANNLQHKLLYYDDVTPPNYEPEFFHKANNDALQFATSNPLKIKVGIIRTHHHKVELKFVGIDTMCEKDMAYNAQLQAHSVFKSGKAETVNGHGEPTQIQITALVDAIKDKIIQTGRVNLRELARICKAKQGDLKLACEQLVEEGFLKSTHNGFQLVVRCEGATTIDDKMEVCEDPQSERQTVYSDIEDTPVEEKHNLEPPPLKYNEEKRSQKLTKKVVTRGQLEFENPKSKKRNEPSACFSQDNFVEGAKCSVVKEPVFQAKKARRS